MASPLPAAELHLHIEGTLEPELLVALARRNGVTLATTDLAELRARYRFADLQSFLDVYYASLPVLCTDQDFYDLASAYLDRAAAAGVRRAEIFVDPQTHLGHGVPLAAVFAGLTGALADGRARHGLSADLIPCFLRNLGPAAADETLTAVLPFRDQFIGVGLDSTEIGFPPSLFRDVYRRAAAEDLHLVAHAGEEGGPDYVWEALDVLGAERIDHGIRAMEDPALRTPAARRPGPPDRVPAVQRGLAGGRLAGRAPAAGHAGRGPASHPEQRRPGLLRRLPGRERDRGARRARPGRQAVRRAGP